jgi:Lrp/AsnC family transcriptional regulator, leucine-responsive regulatory protein
MHNNVMKFDAKNKKILNILQSNGKITNNELSEEVNIPSTTIFERIKKMEKEEIIIGYKALLDPNKIDFGLTAFVFIRTEGSNYDDSIVKELQEIPFVLEIHEVAGEYSYIAKVCAQNNLHLSDVLKNYLGKVKGILNTNSQIVLKSALINGNYPIILD